MIIRYFDDTSSLPPSLIPSYPLSILPKCWLALSIIAHQPKLPLSHFVSFSSIFSTVFFPAFLLLVILILVILIVTIFISSSNCWIPLYPCHYSLLFLFTCRHTTMPGFVCPSKWWSLGPLVRWSMVIELTDAKTSLSDAPVMIICEWLSQLVSEWGNRLVCVCVNQWVCESISEWASQ